MASHHQLDSDLGPGCSEPPQCSCAGAATLRSGWLLRASGAGPRRQWRRCWAYLTADRMYHTTATDPAGTPSVQYIPLDRLPVRALPRGYAPAPGVSTVDSRQVAPRGGSVFAVVCGAHTHFFAAPTPEEAEVSQLPPREAPVELTRCHSTPVASPLSLSAGGCRLGWRPSRRPGCAA